jgi:hypothetical protein
VVWVVVNSVNPTCAGDFDFNGSVDIGDLLLLLASWGSENPALDLAPAGGDGIIDIADLLDLLSRWGEC